MERRSFIKGAGAAAVGGAAASTLATPALAQQRIEMVIVSSWGRDFPGLGTGAQRLAQKIQDTSDGRIQVQYFAAGERVGAFDAFDEVASGNAQAYHSADYYWKGKHPAWAYFTSVPFGLTCNEMASWIHHMGGQQLWDKLAGEYGLKCLPSGNTGVQMGGWFNKEINSADDLKGLKMRIPGLGGDVMAKLGASPVSLPGGQIYENLVSGAIEATEWVGPWNDYAMKFYEAAKYYYYPGFHEPGGYNSLGMNASWWGSLSKSDQMIIEACASQANDLSYSEYNANNGKYLAKLINEHGVVVKEFNDDVYDAFGEASAEVFEETKAHSALAAEVHESFAKARADVGGWMKLSESAYYAQRNRVLGL
ncbi:MAG: TRAP transporter substrate-binding protein [Pseudomonadota bacterium]|jgi:TRAP-type mannitol/chloroaromatic compound transport system substrate-binding protein|nr:TRAP transporter substrate-binding protein [Alphaproteobacteria bacterium]MEC7535750.1 TRAP transporter substrate-binding protein [Pseudomonadota bacterium]MEC7676094.1 TRAP transporter substrate-binding protein [Pseudomonadota bacterium]MEC8006329.1 TRAP transporter substrate-binding protein [Pseudomonadota bacterium]MEC8054452.1 TRAP transporter substrate-binding protein [Pseudomonadota bacterium]|tara:strand:+ start:662 stop:1756 length:1095 start_codon:yes stop_codon:yes gene_type:complete